MREGPVLREVNRRIHALTRVFDGPTGYLCECGRVTCSVTNMVDLDATEFADVLAMPDTLLVAPGHETPGTEVVRRRNGYLIVRHSEQLSSSAPPA